MVADNKTIIKILSILEEYFIAKNKFELTGESYKLILLLPGEQSVPIKYSWLISAAIFDKKEEIEIVNELFTWAKEKLTMDEYNSILRINVLNSNHPFVKNVGFGVPFNCYSVQFNQVSIGDLNLHNAIYLL
jgi:hypothetical protein